MSDAIVLDAQSPTELEARRAAIMTEFRAKYKGYDDPDLPTSLLAELAQLTQALRRRKSGPPKSEADKARAKAPKATTSDLDF